MDAEIYNDGGLCDGMVCVWACDRRLGDRGWESLYIAIVEISL